MSKPAWGPGLSRARSNAAFSGGRIHSSAPSARIQSVVARSSARCFWAEKPGKSVVVTTRAPDASAISLVSSVLALSIRIFSSTKSAESRQRRKVRPLFLVIMISERDGLAILAASDSRFLAAEQSADVLVMAQPDQGGDKERDRGKLAGGDEPGDNGGQRYRAESRQRGIAECRGDQQPRATADEADPPIQRQQYAQAGGHALAPFEAKPQGIEMADERAAAGQDRRIGSPVSCDQHGERTFAAVKQQRRRGQAPMPRA